MRQFRLVSLFLLLSVMHYSPADAQATRISSGGTLPTACSVGNIYIKTGTGVGFYACLAANTWSGPYDIGTGVGTVTHTAGALVANQLVIGNALADLKTLGSLGTTTTVLHGNAGGAPTFGAVSLTTDVSGVLPVANFTTGTPTGSKFVRDDGVLAVPAGTGTGTVTSIATTSPITGGTITTTGTIACATCVVSTAFDAATVVTDETTTSTSYTDLSTSGPAVTITTTGTTALVWITVGCVYNASAATNTGYASVAVSGASTIAASDNFAGLTGSEVAGHCRALTKVSKITGLTPGSNTFTMKYRVDGSTYHYFNRAIAVFAP